MNDLIIKAAKKVHLDLKPLVKLDGRAPHNWDEYSECQKKLFPEIIKYYMSNPSMTAKDGYSGREKGRCHVVWESLSNLGRMLEKRCRAEALRLVNHG